MEAQNFLSLFTRGMFESVKGGNSVLRSLRRLKSKFPENFQEIIERLIDKIESGAMLSEAMGDEPIFSGLYLEIIKKYEIEQKYLKAFRILAELYH